MIRISIVLVPFIFLFVWSCKERLQNNQENSSEVKIVGGVNVAKNDPLYSMTVQVNSCSGSVLDERWILTAGHCVASSYGEIKTKIAVKFDGEKYPVDKVLLHPKYNIEDRRLPHDIAMVRMARPISKNATPINITPNFKIKVGDLVTLAGFGVTGNLEIDLFEKIETRFLNLIANTKDPKSEEFLAKFQELKKKRENAYSNYVKTTDEFSYYDSNPDFSKVREAYYKFDQHRLDSASLYANAGYTIFSEDRKLNALVKERLNVVHSKSAGVLRKTTSRITDLPVNFILNESDNGLSSACKGDSGGPMFIRYNGLYYQIGVTHGVNYTHPGSYNGCRGASSYSNIFKYIDFIKSRHTI